MICSNLLACTPTSKDSDDALVEVAENIKNILLDGKEITVGSLTYGYCDLFTWATEELSSDDPDFTQKFVDHCLNASSSLVSISTTKFWNERFTKAAEQIAQQIAPQALKELAEYYQDEEPRHEFPDFEKEWAGI